MAGYCTILVIKIGFWGNVGVNIKRKKSFMLCFIVLSFSAIAIISNFNSLEITKSACIENNKTPNVEKDFLAINWSVSCE
ncbi:hypothetical protein ACFWDG_23815 [Peribacillus sp. NPDC060186]